MTLLLSSDYATLWCVRLYTRSLRESLCNDSALLSIVFGPPAPVLLLVIASTPGAQPHIMSFNGISHKSRP